jgi:hypothetical protein
MAHKFVVGQSVGFTRSILRQAAAGEYEIRRLMPATDDDPGNPCYRIRSIAENYERAVFESEISLSRRFDSVLS